MKTYKTTFGDVKPGMHIGSVSLYGSSSILKVTQISEDSIGKVLHLEPKDGKQYKVLIWDSIERKSTFLNDNEFLCCDPIALQDLCKDCISNMDKERAEKVRSGICNQPGILEYYNNPSKYIAQSLPDGRIGYVLKSSVGEEASETRAESLTQELANTLVPEEVKQLKYHSVLLFFRRCEISDTDSQEWVLTRKQRFDNHQSALQYYANTACPASQLISAETEEELERLENEMIEHYKDEKWLTDNVYLYL